MVPLDVNGVPLARGIQHDALATLNQCMYIMNSKGMDCSGIALPRNSITEKLFA